MMQHTQAHTYTRTYAHTRARNLRAHAEFALVVSWGKHVAARNTGQVEPRGTRHTMR